jgi:phosphoribosylamine---glycine ligase
MKFAMISKAGEGAGLLSRIQDEGNDVRIFIKEEGYRTVYKGILEQLDSIHSSWITPDTIIIFDSSGMGSFADDFKDCGYKVFGASKFADKLEDDREFGLSFMEDNDIMIPHSEKFTDFSEGIAYIKKNKDTRFVFKPSGELPSHLTYSCSDCDDLIHYIEFVKKYYSKEVTDFVLQEFIEGKIISTEFFCGPNGFIENSLNHTVESKKLMNDDLGPSTGCAGNLVWLGDEYSQLAKKLRNIEGELISQNFIGPIDLNAMLKGDEIYGLEWTPRFGLDALPTFLQLIQQEVGKLISDIVQGIDPKFLPLNAFAGGVRVSIPPYPIEPKPISSQESLKRIQKTAPNLGVPIRGLDNFPENVYFYEVMKEGKDLVHSAGTGAIAVVSNWDADVEQCLTLPYEILEECKIPDKQYRTDLNQVLPEMHKEACEAMEALV